MDQDFHFYGTYFAAKTAGWDDKNALLIAKCANFIDFLTPETYQGYWKIVDETKTLDTIHYPRYTFQGTAGTGFTPATGIWGSFHFLPGNYKDPPNSVTSEEAHGDKAAKALAPGHVIRTVSRGETERAARLTRPQSALSRALIKDTVRIAKDEKVLKNLLECSVAGGKKLSASSEVVEKFRSILIGTRCHVIADTWAHQDWCGLHTNLNMYEDNRDDGKEESTMSPGVRYKDRSEEKLKYKVLSTSSKNPNLQGAPGLVGHIGHGWIGHIADFSYAQYEYKPSWKKKGEVHLRDNPTEFKCAFIELCSMMSQAGGKLFDPSETKSAIMLKKAVEVINSGFDLTAKFEKDDKDKKYKKGDFIPGQECSKNEWIKAIKSLGFKAAPDIDVITGAVDPKARLQGELKFDKGWTFDTGTFTIQYDSELYLFELAADYHFRFVKDWLKKNLKIDFSDSWDVQPGAFDWNKYCREIEKSASGAEKATSGTEITKDSAVCLKNEEKGKFVGKPRTHASYPCATFNKSPEIHKFCEVDGNELKNNSKVRIVVESDAAYVGDGYANMYCTGSWNVYYDKSADNNKQFWNIKKTKNKDNSDGDKLCYGDEVAIYNLLDNSKPSLSVNGDWMKCASEGSSPTKWILSAE